MSSASFQEREQGEREMRRGGILGGASMFAFGVKLLMRSTADDEGAHFAISFARRAVGILSVVSTSCAQQYAAA